MSVLQALGHLNLGYIWGSISCGFPMFVWGKDCDIIVTFLTCSSDAWCMFLRHLMSVHQAFGQLYFGYTRRSTSCGFPMYVWGEECDIFVTFLTCSSDVWCMFLRLLVTYTSGTHEEVHLMGSQSMFGERLWYYCDISNMFLRRLMCVPPAFDACSSDIWCMIIRHLMSVPQAFGHLYFGHMEK